MLVHLRSCSGADTCVPGIGVPHPTTRACRCNVWVHTLDLFPMATYSPGGTAGNASNGIVRGFVTAPPSIMLRCRAFAIYRGPSLRAIRLRRRPPFGRASSALVNCRNIPFGESYQLSWWSARVKACPLIYPVLGSRSKTPSCLSP